MGITIDLIDDIRLRAEGDERDREERERKKRLDDSLKNLLSLVNLQDLPATAVRIKKEAGLVALQRGYEDILNSGVQMTPNTYQDFLEEFAKPGTLADTFQQGMNEGILNDDGFRAFTMNRYTGLETIAGHLKDSPGVVSNEDYWKLIGQTQQGTDITGGLRSLDPSFAPEELREFVPPEEPPPGFIPPMTVEGAEGRQFVVEAQPQGETISPLGAGKRIGLALGETLDVPRQELGVPAAREVLVPALEALGAPAEIAQERLESLGVPKPVAVAITGGAGLPGAVTTVTAGFNKLPEDARTEVLSYVVDPLNLIFFPGKAAKGIKGGEEALRTLLRTKKLPRIQFGRPPPTGAPAVRAAEEVPVPRPVEAAPAARAEAVAREAAPAPVEPVAAPAVREVVEAAPVEPGLSAAERELAEAGIPPIRGGDPTLRVIELIDEAKPIAEETIVLRAEESRRLAGAVGGVLEQGRAGKLGARQTGIVALGKLKGQRATAQFEPIASKLRPEEVEGMFLKVQEFDWAGKPLDFPKAWIGLNKILEEGVVPNMSELRLLERIFGSEFIKSVVKKRPLKHKIIKNVLEFLNIPRALLATADLSATLRQGAVYSVRHPKEVFGNIPSQVRAFFSEAAAKEIDDSLRKIPEGLYDDGARQGWDKIFHAERSAASELTEREEVWIGRMLQRFPILGQIAKASERAYVTYLNKLRKDVYYNVVRKWQGQGKKLNDYLEYADAVNKGSGRGSLGPLSPVSPILSAGFFAPRFAVSRFQFPLKLFSSSPATRRMVAEEMASFIAAGSTFLGFLHFSGLADVEIDPRSTNFGKIKVGKTRIDFWGGWQPIVRYAAQVATGKRKASSDFIYDADRLTTLGRFAEGKLSPQAGFMIDVLRNQTFLGEELLPATPGSIKTQAFNRLSPIFVQDVVDAMRGEGLLGGLLAAPGIFGVGVATYQTPYDRIAAARQEVMQDQGISEQDLEDNRALLAQIDSDPKVRAIREELDADIKLHGGPPSVRVGAFAREIRGDQMSSQRSDDNKLDAKTMDINVWRARADDRAVTSFNRITGAYDVEGIEFRDEGIEPGTIDDTIKLYYDVKIEDFTFEDTGEIDWDGFLSAREEALGGLSPDDRQLVDEYIHRFWTDKQWEIFRKEEQVREYFEIPNQAYAQQAARLGLTAESYSAYRREVTALARAEAVRQGLDPEFAFTKRILRSVAPEWSRLQDAVERERKIWRRRNPDKTRLLIELGFKTPSGREAIRFRGSQPAEPASLSPDFEGLIEKLTAGR